MSLRVRDIWASSFGRGRSGFTLLETITVLLLLGILTAVVVTASRNDSVDLAVEAEMLKSRLRYTQARSMNTNSVWYIQFAAGSYSLYQDGAARIFLGQDGSVVNLPAGVNVNAGGSGIVSFDSWGRPCSDAAGSVLQAADRTLAVTEGSDTINLTLTANTGYIP